MPSRDLNVLLKICLVKTGKNMRNLTRCVSRITSHASSDYMSDPVTRIWFEEREQFGNVNWHFRSELIQL
jgi:hypothetical protein